VNQPDRAPSNSPSLSPEPYHEFIAIVDVPTSAWLELFDRAVEPNAFYHPDWALPANWHIAGKDVRALLSWDGPTKTHLIGFMPVTWAWKSLLLPVPVLVAWQAYAPLTTPLLNRDMVDYAARGLIAAGAAAGAAALLLPLVSNDGPAAASLRRAAAMRYPHSRTLNYHLRARLDARPTSEGELKKSVGTKKFKELRRQRNRLANTGEELTLSIARLPSEVAIALEGLLWLEKSGWKGLRGTAMEMNTGTANFIREAVIRLSSRGNAEILTLLCGSETIAAALVLRHGTRAFFFKVSYDERLAKMSPGVQLTLELTRHLCCQESIQDADSVAIANHPMISGIWRDRLGIADLVIPTKPGKSLFFMIGIMIAARSWARDRIRSAYALRAIRDASRYATNGSAR
jgi:CelD/BcsL family acetyltransferase involved in cellulose biosynthesis